MPAPTPPFIDPRTSSSPDPRALQERMFGGAPWNERNRTYFGRSLNLNRIELAIRSANVGLMRDMTDLSLETASLDGKLNALLQKRINRVAALQFDVVAASGEELDETKARLYAEVVRRTIEQMQNWQQVLVDMQWATFNGRACLENNWQLRAGGFKIPWRLAGLDWIHPRRLSFGPLRDLRIVNTDISQSLYDGNQGFPVQAIPWKFTTYTPRMFSDYPEREGLAPRCLYWSFFKRFGTRERLILLELFGKPWRIIKPQPNIPHDVDELYDADEIVDGLSSNSTARLPVGVELDVVSPGKSAGQVHEESIDAANAELAQLVVGVTGTTETFPTGIGTGLGLMMQDEQWLVIASDACRLAPIIKRDIADAIIAVNFGYEELPYSPSIIARVQPPPEPKEEIENLTAVITKLGLPISLEEAYKRTGFNIPDPLAARIVMVQVPGAIGSTATAAISYPDASSTPKPGFLAPAPIDVTAAITSALPAVAAVNDNATASAVAAAVSRGAIVMARTLASYGVHVCMARQPGTVNGSPDDIMDPRLTEGSKQLGAVGHALVDSLPDTDDAALLRAAIDNAEPELDLEPFENTIDELAVHTAMLGALDARWEREADDVLKPTAFTTPIEVPEFATKPFAEAVTWFKAKKVLPKGTFDALRKGARMKAFTIAGAARKDLVQLVHTELARQLQEGANLRDFKRFAKDRLESAGWTPVNNSHVETIFRTNTMGAYNAGRVKEMTQPAVLKVRPYWKIKGVDDGPPRQRATHHAASGLILKADDPFWQKAYPPFGYNCRCRVVSVSQKTAESGKIVTASDISDLPDPGFDSGIKSLF